jgi:hypothetical protein
MLVQRVLPMLPPDAVIWEAAGGAGHLVDPLRQAGREVSASDLYPGHADIAIDDFLQGVRPDNTDGAVMITNPPNSQLTAFLMHGLALIDAGHLQGLALLTRLGADGTKGRGPGFNRAAYAWKTCWRPYWEPRQPGDKSLRLARAMDTVAARPPGSVRDALCGFARSDRAAAAAVSRNKEKERNRCQCQMTCGGNGRLYRPAPWRRLAEQGLARRHYCG